MAAHKPASLIASLPNKQVAVSVQDDIVMIELLCGDAYLAQVLYDDLTERLQAGKGITLDLQQQETSK